MPSLRDVQQILALREEKAALIAKLADIEKDMARIEKRFKLWLKQCRTKRGVINDHLIAIKSFEKIITQWAKAFAKYLPDKVSAVKRNRRFSEKRVYEKLEISPL